MIRVQIVDDHAIVRSGLRRIIEDEADMTVAGECSTAVEVLALTLAFQSSFCDVLLLDISLPDKNGLEVLGLLKKSQPGLPVLILSMYPEDQYAIRAMKAGAAGYLTKESAPEQLVEAIRRAASGKKFITPAVAEKLAETLGRDGDKMEHEELSDREFQIFKAITAGNSLTDIANTLSISVKTVSTYRTRIMEKMRLSKNSELVQYAKTHNLIS